MVVLRRSRSRWTLAWRDGDTLTWVVELTGLLDLSSWPKGMRVIVCEERPDPGAQSRFTDIDGHRFTCFVIDTPLAEPGITLACELPAWVQMLALHGDPARR